MFNNVFNIYEHAHKSNGYFMSSAMKEFYRLFINGRF